MRVPTPRECGLPEKFDRWRPDQEEALGWLLSRKQSLRVKALSAPTGFGKTAVYMAYALLTKVPTEIVTDNRGLQDQLMADFAEIGLVDIRGRRNYECGFKDDYTCEEGWSTGCPYKGTVSCPASQAQMRAAISPLVVTNYDKHTASKKYGQGMDHFKQLILDEGHKSPDALARAMQVELTFHEIGDLQIDFPSPGVIDDVVNWKIWATETKVIAEEAFDRVMEHIKSNPHQVKATWVRQMNHMKNLIRRLGVIQTARPENWIVDETPRGYQFDPIRPGKYAEGNLLLRIPSILVVSATLRPKTLYMIGLPKDSFEFREFPSSFDPARCPIYYIPTLRVDSRAEDLSMLWVRHDQIAARRTDRKGIVQTISYARRDQVLVASRFSNRMLFNPKGEAATDTVETFRLAPPGTILVSPSVAEGYDFPGKDCEWQFVCKIPFPDGRSKILKARQHDDPEYGAYIAINKLVQIFGRGMRFPQDRCENFIVDTHLDWFLPRFKHLAPKWFHNFYKRVETVPPPPDRL